MDQGPKAGVGSPRQGGGGSPRWVAYLLCLLGLPVYLWGMEGERRVGALPADLAVHGLQFPVRIQGATADSPEHLRSLVEGYRPGQLVRIESGATVLVTRVVSAFPPSHSLISLISALFFWMVCLLVFAGRTDRDPGRVFFLSTFSYGLAISVGTVAFPSDLRGLDELRPIVRTICVAMLPVFFVQTALLLPHRRPAVDARPWILPTLFVVGMALAAWRSIVLLRYFALPTYRHWQTSVWSGRFLDFFLVALVGAACLLMYQGGRRAELARERHQLKWLWWGITVGSVPFVFLYTLPRMLVGRAILQLHITRLFAMAIPIAMAFAAVRYQLLNIDVIIRRSLIYGLMAAVLAAIYWFLAAHVFGWIAPADPGSVQYTTIAAALAAVMLYGPTKRVVGHWVDRTFFHIRFSYDQALRRFRMGMARPRSESELARYIRRFTSRLLAPKISAVIVRCGSELFTVGDVDDALARRALIFVEQSLGGRDHVLAAPEATSTPEVESAEFPDALSEAGILLVQPLAASGDLYGLLLLGEKQSERRYIEEDQALLLGIAGAGGAALERLELAHRVAEERIARDRLETINRMKSEFLSRVAHDLRTPVTSINWSAKNLLDGLAGPVHESQSAYLQAIHASAIHLGRLVTNLLELSRLEEGGPAIERSPTSLAAAASEAMTGLGPLATVRNVRFKQTFQENLGPVVGSREKLVQVLVNLLENAIRYSPSGATVEVTLQQLGDEGQRLAVRDFGPGIRPGEEEAIFERFHQGAPSPYAQPQGFGLGLYMVKAHVEALGGAVRVSNPPGGGAEFAVLLREWAHASVATV